MLGQPDAKDLVEAAGAFLDQVAAPALEGHAAFHAKVAVNVLAIVARELEHGPAAAARESAAYAALGFPGDLADQRSALSERIRTGRIDATTPGLLEALEAIAADRVAIEQPSYASLRLARCAEAQTPA